MSEGEGKSRGVAAPSAAAAAPPYDPFLPPQNHYYGTFQGVANYPPQFPSAQPPPLSQPSIGFPQLIASPGTVLPTHYYHHGYQAVPGYAVVEGSHVREHRLPCCGMGLGWFLFIAGFFLGAIPWYVGAFLLLCVRMDYREKPGLIVCTLAAIIAVIALTMGVNEVAHSWQIQGIMNGVALKMEEK